MPAKSCIINQMVAFRPISAVVRRCLESTAEIAIDLFISYAASAMPHLMFAIYDQDRIIYDSI